MSVPNGRTWALIHSPLVDAYTWSLVADELARRGEAVRVPEIEDDPDRGLPFWRQHAESAARDLKGLPPAQIILAGHSGAGALLPAIREALGRPVAAYFFVDAGLPQPGRPRLDPATPPGSPLREVLDELERGGAFPAWRDEELREVLPDPERRRRVLAGLRPRRLPFWQEPIPVFAGWPDAPCACLQFSPFYGEDAAEARRRGWPTRVLEAGHFHMLVDPAGTSDALLALAAAAGV
jgi:hypothetical protein